MQPTDFSPYSGVLPLIRELPSWMSEEDAERIGAYEKYEEIYWQDRRAFKLLQRGSEREPLYVPNAMTVCDSTAHYLLKGLAVQVADGDKEPELQQYWRDFLRREAFLSTVMVAKHSGVVRGDWVLHVTADETKPEGSRVSIVSVDPAAYVPTYDPDNVDRVVEVRLVEQVQADGEPRVKEKRYWYEIFSGLRRVLVEEALYDADGWGTDRQRLHRQLMMPTLLPKDIPTIPVYHFKNRDWQGWPFGASELKGFEGLAAATNQQASDTDLALSLQGLGVYATDAGPPRNPITNEEEDWEVAPARVVEVPAGSYFKRVEGLSTVSPALDFIRYLEEAMFESSATFRAGQVDVQVAQSGIALAIRFLPTLAKIEQRDLAGVDRLNQLQHDLKLWHFTYEPQFKSSWLKVDVSVRLGEKLPQDRSAEINELNNMLDRKVISRAYYRQRMRALGHEFPEDMEEQIRKEKEEDIEMQRKTALATANSGELSSGGNRENKSNNKNRTNESDGTESG